MVTCITSHYYGKLSLLNSWFSSISSLEHFFNIWDHWVRKRPRMHEFMNFPIWSDEEFSEIPRNLMSLSCLFIVQLRVESQKFKDFTAILTINFNLIENRKIHIEICLRVLFDFCVIPWLLSHELIRRESKNLESLGFVLFVEFD